MANSGRHRAALPRAGLAISCSRTAAALTLASPASCAFLRARVAAVMISLISSMSTSLLGMSCLQFGQRRVGIGFQIFKRQGPCGAGRSESRRKWLGSPLHSARPQTEVLHCRVFSRGLCLSFGGEAASEHSENACLASSARPEGSRRAKARSSASVHWIHCLSSRFD
jgi:hypothetical protein